MEARMIRAEIAFPATLFAVAVALVAGGWIVDYSWSVIGFPLGIGVLLCGLCLMQIATALAGGSVRVSDEEPLEPLTIPSVVWVFALPLFLYGLGFVFGPAAYLLAYLRANGTSWIVTMSAAAGSMLVTWLLFIKVMRILLPVAPIWMP
jgi:hypothetical protein